MARKRIGAMLEEKGYINEFQLVAALSHQRKWKGKLGKSLIELGYLDEDKLYEVLSEQLEMPLIPLKTVEIRPEVMGRMTRDQGKQWKAVPVEFNGEYWTVAVCEQDKENMLKGLSDILGAPVKLALATETAVSQKVRKMPEKVSVATVQPVKKLFVKNSNGEMTMVQDEPSYKVMKEKSQAEKEAAAQLMAESLPAPKAAETAPEVETEILTEPVEAPPLEILEEPVTAAAQPPLSEPLPKETEIEVADTVKYHPSDQALPDEIISLEEPEPAMAPAQAPPQVLVGPVPLPEEQQQAVPPVDTELIELPPLTEEVKAPPLIPTEPVPIPEFKPPIPQDVTQPIFDESVPPLVEPVPLSIPEVSPPAMEEAAQMAAAFAEETGSPPQPAEPAPELEVPTLDLGPEMPAMPSLEAVSPTSAKGEQVPKEQIPGKQVQEISPVLTEERIEVPSMPTLDLAEAVESPAISLPEIALPDLQIPPMEQIEPSLPSLEPVSLPEISAPEIELETEERSAEQPAAPQSAIEIPEPSAPEAPVEPIELDTSAPDTEMEVLHGSPSLEESAFKQVDEGIQMPEDTGPPPEADISRGLMALVDQPPREEEEQSIEADLGGDIAEPVPLEEKHSIQVDVTHLEGLITEETKAEPLELQDQPMPEQRMGEEAMTNLEFRLAALEQGYEKLNKNLETLIDLLVNKGQIKREEME